MSAPKPTDLTIKEALKLLQQYSCTQIKNVTSPIEKQRLRESIILISSFSEWQNFGVCADNITQGYEALLSYLKALGYQIDFEENYISKNSEPVYIKFNTQKLSHYLDSYSGDYRGVLISCQSEDDNITGTYGHFPLDLFLE